MVQAPSFESRPPKLLRDRDLARTLNISVRSVWKLVADGELPAPIRLGRSTRWREHDIARWLESPKREHAPRTSSSDTAVDGVA